MMKTQDSKRNSVSRDERFSHGLVANHKINRNKSQKGIVNKNSDRRESKTSSHYATIREKSTGDRFEHEVGR